MQDILTDIYKYPGNSAIVHQKAGWKFGLMSTLHIRLTHVK